MELKAPDRINFECARCECAFFMETNRLAAGQQVVCPNCGNAFNEKATEAIGKAAKALFGSVPVGFTWWFE